MHPASSPVPSSVLTRTRSSRRPCGSVQTVRCPDRGRGRRQLDGGAGEAEESTESRKLSPRSGSPGCGCFSPLSRESESFSLRRSEFDDCGGLRSGSRMISVQTERFGNEARVTHNLLGHRDIKKRRRIAPSAFDVNCWGSGLRCCLQ